VPASATLEGLSPSGSGRPLPGALRAPGPHGPRVAFRHPRCGDLCPAEQLRPPGSDPAGL